MQLCKPVMWFQTHSATRTFSETCVNRLVSLAPEGQLRGSQKPSVAHRLAVAHHETANSFSIVNYTKHRYGNWSTRKPGIQGAVMGARQVGACILVHRRT
jgi:hypothetical protein